MGLSFDVVRIVSRSGWSKGMHVLDLSIIIRKDKVDRYNEQYIILARKAHALFGCSECSHYP